MGLEIYSSLPMHQAMLADRVRNAAYRRALEHTVRPDSVVLDVGAGTGVLAAYAAQAGARRVYAIEQSPIVAVAQRTARRWGGRIRVLAGSVERVAVPEKVDLIVSEWMGAFGIDENLLGMVLQARDRWLVPGGRLLPGDVTACMAPVEGARRRSVALHGSGPARCGPMRWSAAGLPGAARLGASQPLWSTNMATVPARQAGLPHQGRAQWQATREGLMDGLVAWFEADFGAGLTLSNAPGALPTHWGQFVFALERPVPVRAGTVIEARLTSIPAAAGYCHHAWSVRVAGGRWQHHDTRGCADIGIA